MVCIPTRSVEMHICVTNILLPAVLEKLHTLPHRIQVKKLEEARKEMSHKLTHYIRIRSWSYCCIVCFACLLPQLAFSAPIKAPKTVALQLKWRHQFQFAGYYAAILQHSPEALFVRKDSGISNPHDLIGKTIMLRPNADVEVRAMLLR